VLAAYLAAAAGLPATELCCCPDQFVGYVGADGYITRTGNKQFEFRKDVAGQTWDLDPFIMVLESPHVWEFRAACRGPAQSTTGRLIRSSIGDALRGHLFPLETAGPRPLVLMNAIQHQTSLGVKTKFHRDDVFLAMWADQAVRADFIRRLQAYTAAGGFVINCCTKGANKLVKKLYELVEEGIAEALGRSSHLSIKHPGGWLPNEKGGRINFAR